MRRYIGYLSASDRWVDKYGSDGGQIFQHQIGLPKTGKRHTVPFRFRKFEMKKMALTTAASILICMCTAAYAEIKVGFLDTNLIRVNLFGEITSADAEYFEKLPELGLDMLKLSGKRLAVQIHLNTPGGDVRAAMRIGRVARKIDALVRVARQGSCYSSCVLVLAGAGRRGIYEGGKVGIHRPFDPAARATSPDRERAYYLSLQREIEEFLRESNVDTRLLQEMMLVPPERIQILTQTDLDRYGLDDDDPYIQESDARNEATKLGISRQELARRVALANKKCRYGASGDEYADVVQYLNCKEKIVNSGR